MAAAQVYATPRSVDDNCPFAMARAYRDPAFSCLPWERLTTSDSKVRRLNRHGCYIIVTFCKHMRAISCPKAFISVVSCTATKNRHLFAVSFQHSKQLTLTQRSLLTIFAWKPIDACLQVSTAENVVGRGSKSSACVLACVLQSRTNSFASLHQTSLHDADMS